MPIFSGQSFVYVAKGKFNQLVLWVRCLPWTRPSTFIPVDIMMSISTVIAGLIILTDNNDNVACYLPLHDAIQQQFNGQVLSAVT